MIKTSLEQIELGEELKEAINNNFIKNNHDGMWHFEVDENGDLVIKYGEQTIGTPWKKPTDRN